MSTELITVFILTEFHDKDNFEKVYEAGEEAEFDETRAKQLRELGYVEFQEEVEEITINLSESWQKVVSAASKCNNEEALNASLTAEKASEKQRMSVLEAIEERLSEINKGL